MEQVIDAIISSARSLVPDLDILSRADGLEELFEEQARELEQISDELEKLTKTCTKWRPSCKQWLHRAITKIRKLEAEEAQLQELDAVVCPALLPFIYFLTLSFLIEQYSFISKGIHRLTINSASDPQRRSGGRSQRSSRRSANCRLYTTSKATNSKTAQEHKRGSTRHTRPGSPAQSCQPSESLKVDLPWTVLRRQSKPSGAN